MGPGEMFIAEDGNVYMLNSMGEPVYIRPATEVELAQSGYVAPPTTPTRNTVSYNRSAAPRRSLINDNRSAMVSPRSANRSLLRSNSRSLLNPTYDNRSTGVMGTGKLRKLNTDYNNIDENIGVSPTTVNKVNTITNNCTLYKKILDVTVTPLTNGVVTHDKPYTDDDILMSHPRFTKNGNTLHSMCIYRMVDESTKKKLDRLYEEYATKNESGDTIYLQPLDVFINSATTGNIEDQKYINNLYTKLVANAPADPKKSIFDFRKTREAVESGDTSLAYVINAFDRLILEINSDPNKRNWVLPYFTRVLYFTADSVVTKELYQSDITINTELPSDSALKLHLDSYGIISDIYIVTPVAIFNVHNDGKLIDLIKFLPPLN